MLVYGSARLSSKIVAISAAPHGYAHGTSVTSVGACVAP